MKKIKTGIKLIKILGLGGFLVLLVKYIFKPHNYKPMKNFKEIESCFINKKGLEIGGPSGFFKKNGFMPIYEKFSQLDGINFSSSTVWTGAIDEKAGYEIDGISVGKQYILDAVDLSLIEKGYYDFVLSCNNIEHIANPMKALEQWLSVLKQGGVIVIVAPRKEANFDHKREIVKYEHLMNDFQNATKEDDLTHLNEILALHDLKLDRPAGTAEQFRERSLKNNNNRCLHHHVFDLSVLKKIFEYFNLSIILSIKLERDYVIVGKKS